VRELKSSGWVKSMQPFCSLCDIIEVSKSRMIRWAGHVAQAGEIRNACMIVCSRNRHEWVSDIKIYLGLGLWEYTPVTGNIMKRHWHIQTYMRKYSLRL
jgi:hypothetical protein